MKRYLETLNFHYKFTNHGALRYFLFFDVSNLKLILSRRWKKVVRLNRIFHFDSPLNNSKRYGDNELYQMNKTISLVEELRDLCFVKWHSCCLYSNILYWLHTEITREIKMLIKCLYHSIPRTISIVIKTQTQNESETSIGGGRFILTCLVAILLWIWVNKRYSIAFNLESIFPNLFIEISQFNALAAP